MDEKNHVRGQKSLFLKSLKRGWFSLRNWMELLSDLLLFVLKIDDHLKSPLQTSSSY